MAMTNTNPYTPGMGVNPQYQPYNQWGYGAAPMAWNGVPSGVSFANSLSDAEIQSLKESRKEFDLNISQEDVTRAMCNHKSPNGDPVHLVNDGSGDVVCEICGARWNPEPVSKEQVTDAVNTLINYLENAKYMGELPINLIREYFTIIPMLRKFPDLYELAANAFNKYFGGNAMWNAPETGSYAMYNTLVGGYNPGMYQGGYYQQPVAQPQYYQQPYAAPQAQPQVTNPAVNPMQATYGVNNAAPNDQFNAQANTMMNGGAVYQQPPVYQQQPYVAPQVQPNMVPQYAPMQPYAPQPQVQQPVVNAQQPVAQPQQAAPAATPETVTQETKISL